MRRRVFLPLVLVLLVLGSSLVVYHSHRIHAQAGSATTTGSTQTTATYTLFAGLWRVDGGFVSTLRIRNSLVVAPLDVTPVLFMADGTEYDLPVVHLPTAGVAEVNINQALAEAPASLATHLSQYGSAGLRYQYTSPGHVLASIQMLNVPQSLIFIAPFNGTDEQHSMPQTVEGLWWRRDPDVGGFVVLANVTGGALAASIQAVGSQGTTAPATTLQLAPQSTVRLDLDSLVGGLPGLENQAGGLRVQYNGPMGGIVATGGLANAREGYSATMPFWSHDAGSSAPTAITYASAGMMVGAADPAAGFPSGTRFEPYAVLRNTTANPLTVSLSLNFMAGAAPASYPLPNQALQPFETRSVDLVSLLASLGLGNLSGSVNLAVSFTGQAGDLVLATGSVDNTGTYVFEVEPQGVGKSLSKQAAYWTVANGFDTMFSLWNPTDQAQDLVATFYYADGSGSYALPVHLDARASAMIDLKMLIASQQPDATGHVFSTTALAGSAIFASSKGRTSPITLVVAGGVLNVQTATCGFECISCCGYSNFTVSPNPLDILVGTTGQASLTATYCDGTKPDLTKSASWGSSDSSIAAVQATPGQILAVASGSATITATIRSITIFSGTICSFFPSCPSGDPQPQTTARARQAKWAVLTGGFNPYNTVCIDGTATVERDPIYSAYDDLGYIAKPQTFVLNEALASPTNCNMRIGSSEKSTETTTDTIKNCVPGCTFESNQTWSIGPDLGPIAPVKAKNCPTCAEHNGWHVYATTTGVIVSGN